MFAMSTAPRAMKSDVCTSINHVYADLNLFAWSSRCSGVKTSAFDVQSDRFHSPVCVTEACQSCDGCFIDVMTKPVMWILQSFCGKTKQEEMEEVRYHVWLPLSLHFCGGCFSFIFCLFLQSIYPIRHHNSQFCS